MKKLLPKVIACILSLCLLVGCSAPDDAAVKTTFTKEELLEDYDYMWSVLEENYLYFSILEERGIDVSALQESTRQQIEARVTDAAGLYGQLTNLFGRMQNFAHLSVLDVDGYDIYDKYYGDTESKIRILAHGQW